MSNSQIKGSDNQLQLFEAPATKNSEIELVEMSDDQILENIDWHSYDRYVVFASHGKDSVAAFLDLLERGIPKERIELHHHKIDGEGDADFMDWPITDAYGQAFADAFGVRLYQSYRNGGFESEMLRENSLTNPTIIEDEDGSLISVGGLTGKLNTSHKFPQLSASLSTRWCSAYLKVDVGAKVFTASQRFKNSRTLVITGERAQESKNRAGYNVFEVDRSDARNGKLGRHIDHVRNVKTWSEQKVWDILKRHGVVPHPAYVLGWGRTSCLTCIFASKNQWSTIRKYMPERFSVIADYEEEFGLTINRKLSVRELADRGTPYDVKASDLAIAMGTTWTQPIIVDPKDWVLPAGAFGESNGPT